MKLVSNWIKQTEICVYIYNKMNNTNLDFVDFTEEQAKLLDDIGSDLKWYGRSKKELKFIPLEIYEMAVDKYGQETSQMWLDKQKQLYNEKH